MILLISPLISMGSQFFGANESPQDESATLPLEQVAGPLTTTAEAYDSQFSNVSERNSQVRPTTNPTGVPSASKPTSTLFAELDVNDPTTFAALHHTLYQSKLFKAFIIILNFHIAVLSALVFWFSWWAPGIVWVIVVGGIAGTLYVLSHVSIAFLFWSRLCYDFLL